MGGIWHLHMESGGSGYHAGPLRQLRSKVAQKLCFRDENLSRESNWALAAEAEGFMYILYEVSMKGCEEALISQ